MTTPTEDKKYKPRTANLYQRFGTDIGEEGIEGKTVAGCARKRTGEEDNWSDPFAAFRPKPDAAHLVSQWQAKKPGEWKAFATAEADSEKLQEDEREQFLAPHKARWETFLASHPDQTAPRGQGGSGTVGDKPFVSGTPSA